MPRTPILAGLTRLLRKAVDNERLSPSLANAHARQALDRRQAVRLGAKTSLALAASSAFRPSARAATTSDRREVAIVGGGVAGLTVAYRLLCQGQACAVYEAAHRTGGRMWTNHHFNHETMFVERGGELVDSSHEALMGLAAELGLEMEGFQSEDQGLVKDLFFANGRQYSEAEAIVAFAPLARRLAADQELLRDEAGSVQVPTYSSALAQNDAVKALDQKTLAAYLNESGLEPWLKDLLRVAYVGEYGREAEEQSALNLVILMSPDTSASFRFFGESDESWRIKGGSESLPLALRRQLAGQVPVRTGQKLVMVRSEESDLVLTFAHRFGLKTVRAERVVLALPFTTLRKVEGIDQLGLAAVKLKAVKELGYGTNSKLMLGFKSRPWREGRPKSAGGLFTTLPSQAFWETSRLQPGRSGILTNFLGGKAGEKASSSDVQQALGDLEAALPGSKQEFDGRWLLHRWADYPHTMGSYSCPLPGQYTTIVGASGESELGGRLFFCGEHCSVDYAGYMNGAVETAEAVAAEILGQRGGAATGTISSQRVKL